MYPYYNLCGDYITLHNVAAELRVGVTTTSQPVEFISSTSTDQRNACLAQWIPMTGYNTVELYGTAVIFYHGPMCVNFAAM